MKKKYKRRAFKIYLSGRLLEDNIHVYLES